MVRKVSLLTPALPMIAGLTTEARICGPRVWIVRALKMQTSIVLLMLVILAGTAFAGEFGPAPRQIQPSTTMRIASPPGPVYSMGVPAPQRPPIDFHKQQHCGHRAGSVPQGGPGAGWSGYGFGGIPTYRWGYFGAHYRPVRMYHCGYYGHRLSIGYRRGY